MFTKESFPSRSCRSWLLILAACFATVAAATGPDWWQQRGVIDANQPLNDFSAVNIGQLKNMADKAKDELQANLPGGSGAAVDALITSFSQSNPDRNDFAVVNIGQLKAVAKPFYDRLIEEGYTEGYPWDDNDPAKNDFAAANIGQLKHVFSFDVMADSDGNDLPDWWEMKYFGQLGADPDGNSDDDDLSNLDEFTAGTDPTLVDTDGDGISDGLEVEFGLNPLAPALPDTSNTLELKILTPFED